MGESSEKRQNDLPPRQTFTLKPRNGAQETASNAIVVAYYPPLAPLLDIYHISFYSKHGNVAFYSDFMDDCSVDTVAAVVLTRTSPTRECMEGMEQYSSYRHNHS